MLTADEVFAILSKRIDTAEIKNRDKTYVFIQALAATEWIINHNLDKYCSVTIVDSANTEIIGAISYIDTNNLKINFNYPVSGKAYCN